MHIGQPVRHQLRVIFDCFEIGAIAHIKAVAGLVEDMRFDGHFGGPVSLQQTDHRRRAAFIVIARQQEGRGCVCGDASRHAERPGVDEQLKIGAAVQAIDWVRSGRIATSPPAEKDRVPTLAVSIPHSAALLLTILIAR